MGIQFNSSSRYANNYRMARRMEDEASPRDAERLQPQKEPRSANRTETKAPNNENFRSVYNEMSANIPDSTSTIEEKQRAIEYINRMLNCPDIPNPEYWENKKAEIQKEIDNFNKPANTGNKTEKFADVFAEAKANLPDSTSTIEEKQRAIEYINRMLNCPDIPNPEYWENKKAEIQNEIDNFNKPADTENKTEKFADVFAEAKANVPDSTSTIEEKQRAIEYIDRMLNCPDIPNPEYWENKKAEIQNEIDNFNKPAETENKTEKFADVFAEAKANLPDSTSTIEEKQRAIEYIDRMLNCPDIPNPEYWENQKMIIEQEIVQIKNEDKVANGENAGTIWQEFSKFGKKYLHEKDFSVDSFKEDAQRLNYLQTYHSTCLTYYKRLLNSSDATPEMIEIWKQEMQGHQETLKLIENEIAKND